MMRSNKQRRAEIEAHRSKRAARAAVPRLQAEAHAMLGAGLVAANVVLLTAHNNTYGLLPNFYGSASSDCYHLSSHMRQFSGHRPLYMKSDKDELVHNAAMPVAPLPSANGSGLDAFLCEMVLRCDAAASGAAGVRA